MSTSQGAPAGSEEATSAVPSSAPPGPAGPSTPGPPITVPQRAPALVDVEEFGGETANAPSVGTEKAIDPARRDNLARYVLLGLAIITVIAIVGFSVLSALGKKDEATTLYDGALKALPPLATLVIGFYFK